MFARFSARLRRFFDAEDGVFTVEAVLILPVLIWLMLALFVWWDAYRTRNTGIKATYVIADMISRENSPVDNSYITGMDRLYAYMSNTPEDTWVRVTSITYRQSTDSYRVEWSRSSRVAAAPALNNTTLNAMRARLPLPADADSLVVVETWRNFTPAFGVGLSAQTFHEFTVVRPRFLSPIPIS